MSSSALAETTNSPGAAALGFVVLYGVVAATASPTVFRTRDIVS